MWKAKEKCLFQQECKRYSFLILAIEKGVSEIKCQKGVPLSTRKLIEFGPIFLSGLSEEHGLFYFFGITQDA